MNFLTGAFLAALPLAAAPVIIHLLNRRRRNVLRWGAMRFLTEAATRRRRMMRLDDLLLMILRAVVVAALVLALAQPVVRSSLFSPAGPRDVVLIVDLSMSASRTVGGETLLDRERSRAEEILNRLGDGDTVRVLLAAGTPRWLTPAAVTIKGDARRELASQLRLVKATQASMDMLRAVQLAAQAEPGNPSADRLVIVLTDGQAQGWRPEAGAAWRQVQKFCDKATLPLRLSVLDVGENCPPGTHLAVESVAASRSIAAAGDKLTLQTTVRNGGDATSASAQLTWLEGTKTLGSSWIKALAPGEEVRATFDYTAGGTGPVELACQIDTPDTLTLDHTGRFVLDVVDKVPLLIVGAAPGRADVLTGDTGYLLAALGYDGAGGPRSWHSVFQPRCVTAAELGTISLSDYYCVVLSNAGPLPDEVRARLADYVRKGGGLWITVGEATTAEAFNRVYFGKDAGLSSLALTAPAGTVGDYEHGLVIHPPTLAHPATALLADTRQLDIDKARVFRRFPFVKAAADRDVSVLLTTGQGEPLAIERRLGRGRVIVLGIPLGIKWSNLPACQAFVPLVHEWLWYLSEPAAPRHNLALGEPLTEVLHTSGKATATVTGPEGEVTAWPVRSRDGRNEIRFDRTYTPGRFQLTVATEGQPKRDIPFIVSRDVKESDLTPLTAEQKTVLTTVGGLAFGGDPLAAQATGQTVVQARPIWWWLLMGLLAVMAVELVLAWRMTSRRNVTGGKVVMDRTAPEQMAGR
jgi:hypothetical protein